MIGVVGATGFTGKLVAGELRRLNAEFFIAGRNETSLKELSSSLDGVPTRNINVQDRSTYSSLEGCSVIINCAGPFTDLGEAIVQEAIKRRAHYLDLTGEQGFIKLVYDKYHEQAIAAGVVLVPACAFEYAIGDAAGSQISAKMPDCSKMELTYFVNGGHTSSGTRKSIVRAFAAKGYLLRNGALRESAPASVVQKTKFNGRDLSALSFPGGEVLMLPRHTKLQDITTFMAADVPEAITPLIAMLGQSFIRLTADLLVNSTSTKSPTLAEREGTSFTIIATGTGTGSGTGSEKDPQNDSTRSITVSGKDPYLLTAKIIAGSAFHLETNKPPNLGAISPSMILDAKFIQELVTSGGVKWSSWI